MSDSHGNSPAAWSAVLVALVGVTVGCVGMLFSPVNWVLFWVGIVLTLVGLGLFTVQALRGGTLR